ncbi:hypothetical protein CEUSTIGMA_g6365.t1 [Chlamydomonas eustigma]|uniref:YqaJ viral recombinase domain-containing protein n=1 Tax=Chlamydomonas eustigma TaxID=1157962 RepID=A0A250X799_9CHLO|nr:hypothetical protein CEUSTIGMA_g6365.t1 [Chlamydomonas eustigma]|eukprot:GAX78926.1 hypothetical protein CEUSTIGMA_g6365.t1 [Chlamydomonas eustigma]
MTLCLTVINYGSSASDLQQCMAVADSASAVTPGGALNEDKMHSQIVSPGRVSSAILQGSGVLEIKCPFYSGAVDNVDKNYKYLFQIQGLMEMLNVEWADLFVYSDMGGEKKALKVRIKRDRAFWAALIPHLWKFWFHHVIPARQAVQKHMLSLEQGGQSSSLSKGAAVVNAKGCWETGEADHCLDDVESEDETGSAGSPSNINSLSENEIALKEVAQKKLKMRENKEATDILKAVVREYLPSAELPNNATRNLDAWAREMYNSAEIHAL